MEFAKERDAIMSGGTEIPLGCVAALRERTFSIPKGGAPGLVRLVARPNAALNGSEPLLSEPFPLTPGNLVSWTLRDRPATSGFGGSPSVLRVTPCQAACQEPVRVTLRFKIERVWRKVGAEGTMTSNL